MKAVKKSSSSDVVILRFESTIMYTLTKKITFETKSVRLSRARCSAGVRIFSFGSSCFRFFNGVFLKFFSIKCFFFVRVVSIIRLKYFLMDRDRGVRLVRIVLGSFF